MKTNSPLNEILLGMGLLFGSWLLLRELNSAEPYEPRSTGESFRRDRESLRADFDESLTGFEKSNHLERHAARDRFRAESDLAGIRA